MKKLFLISYEFPPEQTPLAIHVGKLIHNFKKSWDMQVITKAKDDRIEDCQEGIIVDYVKDWYPKIIRNLLIKLKLQKFIQWLMPFGGEPALFWIIPSVCKARKLIKQSKPDIIVVFLMPYASGLIGTLLKWMTGLPLVLNFDDSPTCTDMHPSFASWIHYKMAKWMEDFYIHQSDAVIYVSQRNSERIRNRQDQKHQSKIHLVRCGAAPREKISSEVRIDDYFQITYTGGMTAWFEFYYTPEEQTLLQKLYRAWLNIGRHEIIKLDIRSSSPFFVGQAVQQVLSDRPEWQGKIKINIYGNQFPEYVVNKSLKNYNLTDIVSVFNPVPHAKAIELTAQSDLLLITLPARPPDSPGGRISVKTYEYLTSDRPILAAVSKGENWDYLENKPGVWLVEPTDVSGMKKAIAELAEAKFSGQPLVFNRAYLYPELSYETRAKEFQQVLDRICN